MELNELKEVIKSTFKKVYGSWHGEYKLIQLGEHDKIKHVNYIITKRTNGVIVEFDCSTTGIYEANSKGNLLQNVAEVKDWLVFIETIKEELRKRSDS